MIVLGGTYYEYCIYPPWNEYYGSGGRAAAALAYAGVEPLFRTCADESASDVIEARGQAIGYSSDLWPITLTPSFGYWTPLHPPSVTAFTDPPINLTAEDDVVLRFGMIEANGIVRSKRAVYDPQSEAQAELFEANGSKADQYAVVLNEREVRVMGSDDVIATAANNIMNSGASAVFVKNGPFGVDVYWNGLVQNVPAFRTARAFTIGSGDVFSAAIALHWGVNGLSPIDAAYLASRAVAEYVENGNLVLDGTALAATGRQPAAAKRANVYIAAPFFNLGPRRTLEDVRDHLTRMGMNASSPLHDIGFGKPREVAKKDLELLERSDVVLALLDGLDVGTIFEMGYARAFQKPVIVLSQRALHELDQTMIVGTDCAVYEDYVAALYATAWSA
jgi:Nucleoside 2-deoxyribosyltransferase